MTDVLTLGETMASMRSAGPLRLGGALNLSIAGSESNVAIGLARLGHTASWVGVVGDDELGSLILRTLRAENVDTTQAHTHQDASTGTITIERRVGDIARVLYHRSESAGSTLSTEHVTRAFAECAPRWVHLTGITPALSQTARAAVEAALDLAAAAGAKVSLDVNYRSRLWDRELAARYLRSIVTRVDLLVASDDELALVTPEECTTEAQRIEWLLHHGVGEVVITRGAAGASLHNRVGTLHQAAAPVLVVDTVGAGDAFTAGLLSATLDDLPDDDRLRRAALCGAFAVGSPGDWEGTPARDELSLLDQGAGATHR